jgi:ABC-type lipoprotein export system ATPase subunit
MPDQFQLNIPTSNDQPIELTLKVGEYLYILGANGSGKSSLVSRIFSQHQAQTKRISAHRQTWFESNTLDMTAKSRDELERQMVSQDGQARSRFWEWNPAGRSNMAIFDLIDADTIQERKIASFVRAGDLTSAVDLAKTPSPIHVINELMRLSNIPIVISVEGRQKIVAQKNGGSSYSVAELSDGERNAFLIAANVITAKAGTLILIDEPERHLHRSIISPLLRQLFEKRKDCAFIVSTHEIMLPVDTPEASTILVRGCNYHGQEVRAWIIDVVPPGAIIDENLKFDLLGARRKILYVEGTTQSLDMPLYSLLFPQVSVIPKENCREVEYAVRGLRNATEMHWVAAWGIVDNDQRPPEDIARLRAGGIFALPHYSVESLYYHPKIIARIAELQARLINAHAETLVTNAIDAAVGAVKVNKQHLVTSAVLRSARNKVWNTLPRREDITNGAPLHLTVDLPALRAEEEVQFDTLVDQSNWDGLLTRYPLRESSAFDRIISGIKIADKATYRAAVLKLLQDDVSATSDLRDLLGDLYGNFQN